MSKLLPTRCYEAIAKVFALTPEMHDEAMEMPSDLIVAIEASICELIDCALLPPNLTRHITNYLNAAEQVVAKSHQLERSDVQNLSSAGNTLLMLHPNSK